MWRKKREGNKGKRRKSKDEMKRKERNEREKDLIPANCLPLRHTKHCCNILTACHLAREIVVDLIVVLVY